MYYFAFLINFLLLSLIVEFHEIFSKCVVTKRGGGGSSKCDLRVDGSEKANFNVTSSMKGAIMRTYSFLFSSLCGD